MKLSSKKHEGEPTSSRGLDTDLSVNKLKKVKLIKTSSSSCCHSNSNDTMSDAQKGTTNSTGGSGKVHPSSGDLTPRERQYLFSAGLHPMQVKKKREEILIKKQSDSLSSVTTSATTSAEEFATRALGSTCPKTRHDAIQRLQLYLSTCAATKGISYLDIKKLWKGMWYGLYMCDKVVVQDELSSHMAQLIWSVAGTIEGDMEEAQHYVNLEELALEEDKDDVDDESDHDDVPIEEDAEDQLHEFHQAPSDDEDEVVTSSPSTTEEECLVNDGTEEDSENENHPHHTSVHLVCLFVKGYFETIHREWGRMDKHRIDKFYRSMRLMLSQVFQYCSTREWHLGIIHMLNDVVFNDILCCDEESVMLKYPNGVRFHLIDILLDEVVKVSNGMAADDNNNNHQNSHVPIKTIEFLALLEPYLTIAMADSDKIVQARVMENILQKFISQYSVLSAPYHDNDTTPLLLHHVNVHGVAEQIFDVASNVDTADRYRSSLYQMHKLYVRKLKEAKPILDGTTHCEEMCCEEAATSTEQQGKNINHNSAEEMGQEEEEDIAEERSTNEPQGHKKHRKKEKKRKLSASDLCEDQSRQNILTVSNGKKHNVQVGATENNKLEEIAYTKAGIDSDNKRSKKRKNDATAKDNSELNDNAKPQKKQSRDNIQLTTAIVDNSRLKRVETSHIATLKKSKLQSMDDKKQRKDDKNLNNLGIHEEGMVLSGDNTRGDCKDVESVGDDQAEVVDHLPTKDKPYLMTKKKRTKNDTNLEMAEVKQGNTIDVVKSKTGTDDKATKFVKEKSDDVPLKNTLQLMIGKKKRKDGISKECKELARDDTVDAKPFKNKMLSADDRHGLNKIVEKNADEVKSKNNTQSMDHKKPKNGDITNMRSVDSGSHTKNPQFMDDEKPVDNCTGPKVIAMDVASDSAATKKKKKKKHKKKHNEQGTLDFIAASKQLDDEIVISLREQSDYLTDAVNSINATGRQKSKASTTSVPPLTKKQQSTTDDAVEKERQRRVKFGCMNRSKSYKASMTALQKMQHPTTATREPEKPILREPKYASSPVSTKDRPKKSRA